jgi:hypothetical protein
MQDAEHLAAEVWFRQALGRLKALDNDPTLPVRVKQHVRYAVKDIEDALKALRGEPTSAAG